MRDQVLALLQRHLPGPFRPSGGGNILTRCPFHKGGQERKPSFSVNLDQGIFHCFTCHEAGDVTKLLKMLGMPQHQITAETKAIAEDLKRNRELRKLEKANTFVNQDPFMADFTLPEAILGVYDWLPTKLVEDGFNPELLRTLDIGFDRVNNRIMYPLRDAYGNLAGFSGGVTPFSSKQWPKYLVYQGRRMGMNNRWIKSDYGEWFDEQFPDYKCENHEFLWNYDKILNRVLSDPNATVYVVEGFKACLWMLQAGFQNTVALMGSYISDRQQQLLHRLGCSVVLFLDNDEAGRNASFRVGDLLWMPMYRKVRVVSYPDADVRQSLQGEENTQPDDYEVEAIHQMVNNAMPFTDYVQYLIRWGVLQKKGASTWQ
jgi:DNA primase